MSDAPEFNFEDFIKGARTPQDTVSFYLADHRDQIHALEEQRDSEGDVKDSRMNTPKSKRTALDKQITELREAMESSKRTVTLRALTPDEYQKVINSDDDFGAAEQLEIQQVATPEAPKFTAEQWRRLGDLMGSGQFMRVVAKANELALGGVESPDF